MIRTKKKTVVGGNVPARALTAAVPLLVTDYCNNMNNCLLHRGMLSIKSLEPY